MAEIPEGAPGGPTGTTALDATDETPLPALFAAVTVKLYEVPLVRPEIVQVVVGAVALHVNEPGFEVTV